MSNIEDTFKLRFPEDNEVIRAKTPHYLRLTDYEIEALWRCFSASYCAQWLNVREETLKEFEEWVRE